MLNSLTTISATILGLIAFLCFCVAITHRKKHKELSHLFVYPLLSFLQTILYFFFTHIHKSKTISSALTLTFSIHFFIIVETICIFFFFYKIQLLSKKTKAFLLVLYSLLIVLYIFNLSTNNVLSSNANYMYYIQSLVILIPCFIYLYQLFLNPPILNLLEEPSFWFNSGLLIYFTSILPIYFMLNYFNKAPIPMVIDFININGYIIIFLFLIKGYKCRVKTTT